MGNMKGGVKSKGNLKVGDFARCKLKEAFKGFNPAPTHQEKCSILKISKNYIWLVEYPTINWTHEEFFDSFNQYNDEDDQGGDEQ